MRTSWRPPAETRIDLPPDGWGNDQLTSFLDAAQQNRWATFANKTEEFGLLIKLDECFDRIAKDWIDPHPRASAHLFLRAHCAFRAACGCAASGQMVETFALLRSTLECAGYALHIAKDPDLEQIWLARHESDASLKVCKTRFLVGEVRETIEQYDRKANEIFGTLYQTSIDFGAHPNEATVTANLQVIELEDRKEYRQIYLHKDGIQLRYALKSTARVGVCALDILECAFRARFQLLGVRHDLVELRRGL